MVKIASVFVTGILVLPVITGLFYQVAPAEILGLVASLLIFQPLAVVVGLGLGISPLPVMLIMCSFGISVIFVLFGICDVFAGRSAWLQKHLEKIGAITQKSGMVKKYGIFALIPFIWVPGIGLYGCVLIAWLLGWRGVQAVFVIFAGWILATLLVLLTSLGILHIIL